MSLFVRIILWGLLLLMLKDARSQSCHQSNNKEVKCSEAPKTPSPKLTKDNED